MADNSITIQPGQFSSTIAKQGGFSVQDLIQANPTYRGFVKDPSGSTIYAGDILNLPVVAPPKEQVTPTTPTMPAEAPKYDIPTLPGDNTDMSAVIKSITGLYNLSGDGSVAEKNQGTLYNDIKTLIDQSKGKTEFQAQQEENAGIPGMQKDIQELTNQINQIGIEQTATELKTAQEPISAGAIRGRNIELERNNAIKALTLSAQIQAKQGNLQIAQSQVNRAVDLKYKPLEDELNGKLKLYDLNKDQLSREDKKRGDIMSAAWQFQLQQLQNKKDDEKKISEYALTAAKNGAPNTLVSQIQNAKTSAEALSLINKGGFLKSEADILDEEYKRMQIKNLQADTQKKLKEINGSGTTEEASNIIAYAQQYASTGQIPTGLPKGTFGIVSQVAKELPKVDGEIVDNNTNIRSGKMTSTQLDAYSAMRDLTTKIDQAEALYKQLHHGVAASALTLGGLIQTPTRQEYNTLTSEIVDLLARARTGAAISANEEKLYKSKLPGVFNQPFFLGTSGEKKLEGLKSSISGKLDAGLRANGVSMYGFSTVKIGDKDYKVGDIISVNGLQGRVNPDGTITSINE